MSTEHDTGVTQRGSFEHVTVINDDEPPECTIFPGECDDEELVTHWITARGSSFVPLDAMQ